MDRCPRCGAYVPRTSAACPQCGLGRPTASAPQPPRRRGGLVLGLVIGLLVTMLAVTAGLWWTDTAPFEPDSDEVARAQPTPPPTVVTVTSPASQATPSASPPTSVSGDFSEIYPQVHAGVGLILVDMCDGSATGSGFLVDDSTLVTAAHVVAGATDVEVDFDGSRQSATVTGVDPGIDLAVLALSEPVDAPSFRLADDDPETGTHVAVIGFPLDEPKSLTEGTISGLDRDITTQSGSYSGLLQTDAAINPGNSGGPLLNTDGDVVGIADAIRTDAQGIGFAIPISQARAGIEDGAGLETFTPADCGAKVDPVRAGVRRTLRSYLRAINTGDYVMAMSLVSPQIRADSDEEQWHAAYATTYDDQLRLQTVSGSADRPSVWATFRSQQDPGYGPEGARDATCLVWSLDYEMIHQGSGYVIGDASGHLDPAWSRCD